MADWQSEHEAAMRLPRAAEAPHVHIQATVRLCMRWREDGFASEYVVDIIKAGRALLNMGTGRLDCATLDRFYCDALRACGEEP